MCDLINTDLDLTCCPSEKPEVIARAAGGWHPAPVGDHSEPRSVRRGGLWGTEFSARRTGTACSCGKPYYPSTLAVV